MSYRTVTFSWGLVALSSLAGCTQDVGEYNPPSEEPKPLPQESVGKPPNEAPTCKNFRTDADGDGYADPDEGGCAEGELPPSAILPKDSLGEDCDPRDPTLHVRRCFDGDGDSRCPDKRECVASDAPGYIFTTVWHAEKDCDDKDPEVWGSIFEDLDGDGYGSDIYRCRTPEDKELVGWSPRAGDCDDEDPEVFPGNFRMQGEQDKSCGDWSTEFSADWTSDDRTTCSGPALALVAPSPPMVCGLPEWVHPPRIVFRIENWGDETVTETITLQNISSVPGGLSPPTWSFALNLQPGETTRWIERAVRSGISLTSKYKTCEDAPHSVQAVQGFCGH